MRKLLDQAELRSCQALPCSQETGTMGGNAEGKGEELEEDEQV